MKTVHYDYEQALAETDANAVYIATPHWLHVKMSRKALRANKHLLFNRPIRLINSERGEIELPESVSGESGKLEPVCWEETK